MKIDTPITQPGAGAGSNPEYLRELAAWADEDKACPVSHAEQLLEHRRITLIQRMTASRFMELDAVERRNFSRWAEHLAKSFSEKASLFRRHAGPDPQAPRFLQAKG